ncbi:MAG: monophosphatase [Patescibacteria group bacterium]|nr:monophosphatase [Patescibacteria group bacterium]
MTTPTHPHEGIERERPGQDFELGQSLVMQAGELVRGMLAKGDHTTEWKPDNTPVTSIDIAVNELVLEGVQAKYPNDRIYGEEQSSDADRPSGFTWILDPIDGTQALEQRVPAFTVCLARLDTEGRPLFGIVYNPVLDELYTAARGQNTALNGQDIHVSDRDKIKGAAIFMGSRMHHDVASNGTFYDRIETQGGKVHNPRALAFGCTQVAAGRADGALIGMKTPFEAAAVELIVTNAGGTVTDVYGNPPGRLDGDIQGLVVSNGLIHESLLEALKK